MSADEPERPGSAGTPSNRPIDPSHSTRSDPDAARPARPASKWRFHRPGIEIEARTARCDGVEGRVDIIRPAFRARHAHAPCERTPAAGRGRSSSCRWKSAALKSRGRGPGYLRVIAVLSPDMRFARRGGRDRKAGDEPRSPRPRQPRLRQHDLQRPTHPLRYGWTTGACATAATRAALRGAVHGRVPRSCHHHAAGRPAARLRAGADRAGRRLRDGRHRQGRGRRSRRHAWRADRRDRAARRGRVRAWCFAPAPGVGTVTRPGLPIPPGEPAINPMPREMMRTAIAEAAALLGAPGDVDRRDLDPRRRGDRAEHAQRPARHRRRALDPRHDRHRRALFLRGLDPHASTVASTSRAPWASTMSAGATGEAPRRPRCSGCTGCDEVALIDMGDFVGGMLKYLRRHPVASGHHRRRLRQDDEAGAGPAGPAFARGAASTSAGWPSACARRAATRHWRGRCCSANAANEVLARTHEARARRAGTRRRGRLAHARPRPWPARA